MSVGSSSNDTKSRVIRALSHDLTASRRALHSVSVSRARANGVVDQANRENSATISSFDPQHDDIMMSTRPNLEEDSQFLRMRGTAQRRAFYHPPGPQQQIPTSVVRNNFQDFDQGPSSSDDQNDDVDDDIQVEIGRGYSKTSHNTPSKLNQASDIIIDLHSPNMHGLGGSPARSRSQKKNDGIERGSLRKNVQLRRASSYAQNERGDDYDDVAVAAAAAVRPSPVAARNSRFTSSSHPLSPQRPLVGTPRSAGNPTQQSFMLPDLPNLTELVSGSYGDGTPIFSRNAKATSRFGAPSRRQPMTSRNHIPVTSVPMPADEKALIASLQLLQERLAQLEKEKSESDSRLDGYEKENMELRAELDARRSFRRSDSALGSTDGEGNEHVKWQIEKTKLESLTQSLHHRLEEAEKKLSISEKTTKRVTKERDSLVAQIGVAFYSSEDLQTEIDSLRNENKLLREEIEELRAQLDDTHDRHDEDTQNWHKKEARLSRKTANKKTSNAALATENDTLREELARVEAQKNAVAMAQAEHDELQAENDQLQAELAQARATREQELKRWAAKEAKLKARVEQKENTIHELTGRVSQDKLNENLRQQNEELRVQLATFKVEIQLEAERHQVEDNVTKSKQSQRVVSIGNGKQKANDVGASSSRGQDSSAVPTTRPRPRKVTETTSSRAARRASAPVSTNTRMDAELSDTDSTTDLILSKPRSTKVTGTTGERAMSLTVADEDLTQLSELDENLVANLRMKIEREMAANRKRRAVSAEAVIGAASVQRKSSMKDLTGRSIASASKAKDHTSNQSGRLTNLDADLSEDNVVEADQETQRSRRSSASRSGTRRRTSGIVSEMTSAFILPDITLTTSKLLRSTLSASAHAVLDKLAPHDTQKCTLCRRILSGINDDDNMDIPTPVPISSRPEYQVDIDATSRPSQPPATALTRVIKELEDEIAHLKLELHVVERKLAAHDPSKAMRKRQALHERIDLLNRTIDAKSNQLYSLYDVLEAHKDELATAPDSDGQNVVKEVQGTKTGRKVVVIGDAAAGDIENEDDSELEGNLPWEGFSDTESLHSRRSRR